MIDEKATMEKDMRSLQLQRRDLRNEVDLKSKRVQELELDLSYSKAKSSHIVL